MANKPPSLDELRLGVLAGDRTRLSQAITLSESRLPRDMQAAAELLQALAPHTGHSLRVGISGPPGAGKSTLIDALGCRLTDHGYRVAVLAVDPSSRISGGSILGDKTRMAALAARPEAFIRPSPSGGSLGGVARRTREGIRLCEAAGFDLVLVETVGVGQSEVGIRDLVDVFLLLLTPAAGDDLQGIKRGVMEQADILAVNKADGDTLAAARRTQADMAVALHMGSAPEDGWARKVMALSAFTGEGLDALWIQVLACAEHRRQGGGLEAWRLEQERRCFLPLAQEALLDAVLAQPSLATLLPRLEKGLVRGEVSVEGALAQVLAAWTALHPPA